MAVDFTVYRVKSNLDIDTARWYGDEDDFIQVFNIRHGSDFYDFVSELFTDTSRRNNRSDIVECYASDFTNEPTLKLLKHNIRPSSGVTEFDVNNLIQTLNSNSLTESQYYYCCCCM